MRKKYFVVIMGISLFALPGCGKKEEPVVEPTTAVVVYRRTPNISWIEKKVAEKLRCR